mgnify:CR=1 FL=1
MKKQIILSSLLSALLIGNCLDTQAANEARTINDLPSMAEVSQNKREVAPEFPGGFNALVEFISKNLKYPKVCQEMKIQGRVVVKFTVKSDGSIDNVRVPKPVDIYLDKEAVRLVKSMPHWTPGTQDGKPVDVEFTLPINFKL